MLFAADVTPVGGPPPPGPVALGPPPPRGDTLGYDELSQIFAPETTELRRQEAFAELFRRGNLERKDRDDMRLFTLDFPNGVRFRVADVSQRPMRNTTVLVIDLEPADDRESQEKFHKDMAANTHVSWWRVTRMHVLASNAKFAALKKGEILESDGWVKCAQVGKSGRDYYLNNGSGTTGLPQTPRTCGSCSTSSRSTDVEFPDRRKNPISCHPLDGIVPHVSAGNRLAAS